MATPPTRVSFSTPAVGYGSTASPKTTPTFDVLSGDLITVTADTEDSTYALNTPTATGGSITWTLQESFTSSSNCTAYVWTGAVGATATGITVSVTRVSGAGQYGFGVTVWRSHGGVGVHGQAAATGGPSLALTCSANSAAACTVGDWNAADGTTRTWRTINGSAMSESLYFRDAAHYTAYSGYTTDVGTAGSKTLGLSAPTGMKYAIVGVEILGTTGATNYNVGAAPATTVTSSSTATVGVVGAASPATTVSSTSTGVVGRVAAAALAVGVGLTATAVVGTSSGATQGVTVGSTSSATVGVSSGAAQAVTVGSSSSATVGAVAGAAPTIGVSLTATASVGSAGSIAAAPAITVGSTSTAVVGKVGDAAGTTTVTLSTTAVRGVVGAASLPIGVGLTATASVAAAGLNVAAAPAVTVGSTSTAVVGTSAGAATPIGVALSASAVVAQTNSAALTVGVGLTATATVADPSNPVSTPADRTLFVAADSRTRCVPAETRTVYTSPDSRTTYA